MQTRQDQCFAILKPRGGKVPSKIIATPLIYNIFEGKFYVLRRNMTVGIGYIDFINTVMSLYYV